MKLLQRLRAQVSLRRVRYPRMALGGGCLLTLFALIAVTPASTHHQPICAFTPVTFSPGSDAPSSEDSAGWQPAISADGQLVAFSGMWQIAPASALLSTDAYLYDARLQTIQYTSLRLGDAAQLPRSFTAPPAISGDGRLIAFSAPSEDYPGSQGISVFDRQAGHLEVITAGRNGAPAWAPALSEDGRFIVFLSADDALTPGDTNHSADVFLHDRLSHHTERISIASNGSQGFDERTPGPAGLAVSSDGRYTAFSFESLRGEDGLRHAGVFLRDRQTRQTRFIAPGADPAMTPDGRLLVFSTSSAGLLHGSASGLVLFDLRAGTYEVIARSPEGDADYSIPSISANGRWVVFSSASPTVVTGDSNQAADVFLYDRLTRDTHLLTVTPEGLQADGPSYNPVISAGGRHIAFLTQARNLTGLPTALRPNIYLCERSTTPPDRVNTAQIPMTGK